jgi:molybdopterin/thiamine biosynthesis adenylyltransferase/rhodanese-related sulfurtransferase
MSPSSPQLSPAELSRYSRHILLGEIGLEGQRRLSAARVLVVGAGGLGSPVALYLAAAGVGTLGIADLDQVEEHNLQRQLLHETSAVGLSKVESARTRIRAANPHINVVLHPDGITADNAIEVFRSYDVIVDGTDNFTARYINNDAAHFAKKPLVFGSIFKFEGQVTVFDTASGGPCYRCLFDQPPAPGSVPGCGEVGVVGALCGVVGSLQAMEAIKLILDLGAPLVGQLVTYDGLAATFGKLSLPRSPNCKLCGPKPTITAPTASPEVFCSNPDVAEAAYPFDISAKEAHDILAVRSKVQLIDVRESWELDIAKVAEALHIPMREVPEQLHSLSKEKHLLILCHHGARSANVTTYLRAQGFEAVSNIRGGIAAWQAEVDPTLARY